MVSAQLVLTALMGVLLVGVVAFLSRVEDWRSYTPLVSGGGGGGGYGDAGATVHREKPAGITRWLTTVDHKDIGLLYGTYGVIAFAVRPVEESDVLVVDGRQPPRDAGRLLAVDSRAGVTVAAATATTTHQRSVRTPVLDS